MGQKAAEMLRLIPGIDLTVIVFNDGYLGQLLPELFECDRWHRVEMNTETQSKAMRHVAFLD